MNETPDGCAPNVLSLIQAGLKAPKGQRNEFGKYNYRSMADINEAVKPILAEYGLALVVSDELVMIGERYYIKATAMLVDSNRVILALSTGYAREEESKKGMDSSQVTGACSSYARKYAANGLFAIDDTKDSDVTNTHGKETAHDKAFDKASVAGWMGMCTEAAEKKDIAAFRAWFETHKADILADCNADGLEMVRLHWVAEGLKLAKS